STQQRREILEGLGDHPLPGADIFSGEPVAPDIEWFMTTAELADLIEHAGSLELMTINPGLARTSDWEHIAYKGGSEPGILNLTTLLVGEDGVRWTVSVTVNNNQSALNEPAVYAAYQAILQTIKEEG
ncbi:MAG: hypothetical protein ACOCVC_00740, partial [Spirochaeta sp.]